MQAEILMYPMVNASNFFSEQITEAFLWRDDRKFSWTPTYR
jgi:hypothetical protein